MFFEIGKTTYGVKFSRVGNRTFSELMKVTKKGLQHTDIVGEAGLFHRDVFNTEMGRKVSLTKLIEEINKKVGLTKEERTEIWMEYFLNNK